MTRKPYRAPFRAGLTLAWANVGKRQVPHLSLLEICHQQGVDVINIQEPACYLGTRTQTHPGYDIFAPIDHWNATSWDEFVAIRPRVLTYVRKQAGLWVVQRRPTQTRDAFWLEINGTQILHVYRDVLSTEMLDLVCGTEITGPTVVGGDFNFIAQAYEPNRSDARGGRELTRWAEGSGMEFTGEIGVPTH